MFRKIADLFIFSSLYIGLCAVMMIWQTNQFLYHSPPSGRLIGFIFFSTICSYNFHWYLTPHSVHSSWRVRWTQTHKALHFILYLAGGVGSAVYFFSLSAHWPALCFGAFVTFLYSAPKLPYPFFKKLKKIAVGKTLFLAFVWMYVTTILPVLVADGSWNAGVLLFAGSRFFLIYAICILFDYRDREDDKAEGIRSLITYFDEKGVDRLFLFCLLLFFICASGLYICHYPLFTVILLLVPGIILAILYPKAKNNFSDYLYYIILDGLMMFSGLLMLIFGI